MSLSQLPNHFINLMSFHHDGRSLSWSEKAAQLLTIIAFFLYFILLAVKSGEPNFFMLLKEHWVFALNLTVITLLLFVHYANTMFLRIEVGMLLLCIGFSLIHIAIADLVPFAPKEFITALVLWQGLAMIWYYWVSHIRIDRRAVTPILNTQEVPYKKLKHAIASTHEDDSYLIIDEKEGRHPIAHFTIKDNAIRWVNASGEKESIGYDYALDQELLMLAKTKELFIMEKNKHNKINSIFTVSPEKLRFDLIE